MPTSAIQKSLTPPITRFITAHSETKFSAAEASSIFTQLGSLATILETTATCGRCLVQGEH